MNKNAAVLKYWEGVKQACAAHQIDPNELIKIARKARKLEKKAERKLRKQAKKEARAQAMQLIQKEQPDLYKKAGFEAKEQRRAEKLACEEAKGKAMTSFQAKHPEIFAKMKKKETK